MRRWSRLATLITTRIPCRQEKLCSGAILLVVLAFFAVGAILADGHMSVRSALVVYGFSSQEEVFTQGIFPAFEHEWETQTGQDLTIEGVFGPSGTLARQIVLGAPADVALFSNAQHVAWLKVGRRLREKTQPSAYGCTPIVIVTRPGNPNGIDEFADLAQPELRLVHPDPRSSGAGEWSVLAEYGSAFRSGPTGLGAGQSQEGALQDSGDPATAAAQLKAIWRNVRLLGPSARATLTLFELGAGDGLVTYEQDALLALERDVALEIVVPPRTIVAQHVAVIVDDNMTASERPMAQAFVDFLLSDAGQRILGRYHLRPGDCQGDGFPRLEQPLTAEDLGGWSRAYAELLDTLWQEEIEPQLDLVPTPRLAEMGNSE
jgi:ABC-type sulfate transport system substrate-binding protein